MIGQAELRQVYGAFRDARGNLERAIATIQGVTRSTSNEAPGRALRSLDAAIAGIDDAISSLETSADSAEAWAHSL